MYLSHIRPENTSLVLINTNAIVENMEKENKISPPVTK